MPGASVWTTYPELETRLRQLHPQAFLSMADIAKRLNREFGTAINKNAVIGKSGRLGLPKRKPGRNPNSKQTDPAILSKRKNERRKMQYQMSFLDRKAPTSRADLIAYKAAQRFLAEPLPPEDTYCPPGVRISLFYLTDTTCRWPYEAEHGFQFCGHDGADMKNGIPYCPYHSVIAYQPKREERQAAE